MAWLADDEPIDIWPDTLAPLEVFEAMSRQWHLAPNGKPLGLRLEALAVVLDAHGIAPAERRAMLADLRTMESAALEVLRGQ